MMPDPTVQIFRAYCLQAGIPEPATEYRFANDRRWRFDYAWPEDKVALEVEGGVFGRGARCPVCGMRKSLGHSSVRGLLRDLEKYNRAVIDGWRLLRVVPDQLVTEETVRMLTALMK